MDKIQKVFAVAFIIDNDKLLIAKRNRNSKLYPEHYELPGGKVEFGEDPSEALKRELSEEMKVKIEVLEPYHTFSFVYKDGSAHGIEIAFYARLLEPKENIRLTEHEDIQWVSQKEINNYKISQKEKQAMLIGFKRLKK